jgi:hypothetical protein
MKTKTTLFLLALVVALGIFIKYESKKPNTAEAQRQSKNVVNFDREKLNGIVILNGDDKIELRRQDRKWRIEAPFKDQADSSAIESFLAALENWQKDTTIPAAEIAKDRSRLDEFGLSKAKLRLKLIGNDMPPEIVLAVTPPSRARFMCAWKVLTMFFSPDNPFAMISRKNQRNSATKS